MNLNHHYRKPLSASSGGSAIRVLAACFIVVLIAVATISFEAVKAGLTNPVKSLRSE